MKDELSQRLARARSHLDAGFDGSDVERALSGLEQRIEHNRRIKRVGVAVSSLCALTLVGWFALRSPTLSPLARPELPLRTQDGSLASVLEPNTELSLQRDGEREVALTLARGAGHFEVSKRPSRRYRVRAGSVEVEVLGTVFDVKRRGERTEVRVVRGAVQVRWPSGQTVLRAGESDWFPRPTANAAARAAERADESTTIAPATSVLAQPAKPPPYASAPMLPAPGPSSLAREAALLDDASAGARREAWRTLARAGKHGEAFRSLDRAPVDDVEGLLLAADAARLSNHPREAALYLERLVKDYPKTAPARLAAFTLGGLLLEELDDPERAARSFARAYTLDPTGPLAEDALAREAEAHARAGQPKRAARAYERYVKRYPEGVRRSWLERYLGR